MVLECKDQSIFFDHTPLFRRHDQMRTGPYLLFVELVILYSPALDIAA